MMRNFPLRLSEEDYEFVQLESEKRKVSMNQYIATLVHSQNKCRRRMKKSFGLELDGEMFSLYWGLMHEYFVDVYQKFCSAHPEKEYYDPEITEWIVTCYDIDKLTECALEAGIIRNEWGVAWIQDFVSRLVVYEPTPEKKVNPFIKLKKNAPAEGRS